MKQTCLLGRKMPGCHRAANAALSHHLQAAQDAAAQATTSDLIHISVECEESDIITDSNSMKWHACFNALLMKPTCREVTINGPERDSKQEAVKDSEVLGRAFDLEGEHGVQRVAKCLEKKKWLQSELHRIDDKDLEGLLCIQAGNKGKQEKLIPPGEGWVRFSDEMLWDPRSKVHFAQIGVQAGQYLMQDESSKQFREVERPHDSIEHPITARAGAGNAVRKGAKMERTVLLPELPKIARLALKTRLSFVDTPASAFAFFQGLRSAEAADWCAKNFHTRLIPLLTTKIHKWETKELQDALGSVLKELDEEVLKSTHALSACSAVLALLLGDRLIVSGVGQVRVALLFDDGSTRQLLQCTSDPHAAAEKERIEEATGVVQNGLVLKAPEDPSEAERVLRAKHVFDLLNLEPGGPDGEKQVRTAYKKLALKVHPDKVTEDKAKETYNAAFSRLERARDTVESMLQTDGGTCRELARVLRFDVHVRTGAASLLGVDATASTDTEVVAEEAEKASKKQIQKLQKLAGLECAQPEYNLAVAICKEAVETLRRPSSVEALPRIEGLLRHGLPVSRAIGARDLRFPSKLVAMEPQSASWMVSSSCRLAMLVGATSLLSDKQLMSSTTRYKKHPKASALRWCQDADSSASSVGAVCLAFDVKRAEKQQEPAAKRQKTTPAGQQKAGTIFLRHILLRHQQMRTADPGARREGSCKTLGEAESIALGLLEKLMLAPAQFVRLCKEKSDCQSAEQAGQMAGHIGWIGRGELEAGLEEAAFALEPNEFGDIVSSSRGVHIFQRLG
eukprot:TRINITY_DN50990_c0_g1_i2.p1 TRINITY_DN50990_c0_g1~~TRINITY_DN50990_c0_g1_i2.p1  ORF type:complete len:819 (-),score=236.47 TRINITY_DN50990_c0_g1_i2:49-2430(-)